MDNKKWEQAQGVITNLGDDKKPRRRKFQYKDGPVTNRGVETALSMGNTLLWFACSGVFLYMFWDTLAIYLHFMFVIGIAAILWTWGRRC